MHPNLGLKLYTRKWRHIPTQFLKATNVQKLHEFIDNIIMNNLINIFIFVFNKALNSFVIVKQNILAHLFGFTLMNNFGYMDTIPICSWQTVLKHQNEQHLAEQLMSRALSESNIQLWLVFCVNITGWKKDVSRTSTSPEKRYVLKPTRRFWRTIISMAEV